MRRVIASLEVPANLYDRPTLLMSLENSGAEKQKIEASYLATNLTWNSDYVLTVARDEKNADLDGWVTVVNNSGTAFHNARLQLVAGDLNRIPHGANAEMQTCIRNGREGSGTGPIPAGKFQRVSFVLALGGKTSVEDKETKQISLLQGSGVPVEKLFIVNGQNFYYHNAQNPGSRSKTRDGLLQI